MNKSGAAAWSWVYGLAFLFALGVLYTVFLYAFEGHIVPVLKETVNNTIAMSAADKQDVYNGIDKYMTYFKIMPYVLFVIVIIYMIITTIYRQRGEVQY